jgi:transcriptional regulator with XRE-family HTH domain
MEAAQKRRLTREFGKRLKKIRLEKKLSQRALAAEADMEHKHIQRIEAGEINPTMTTIVILADALGVDPGDLMKPL